jgi:hypothetical protein
MGSPNKKKEDTYNYFHFPLVEVYVYSLSKET